MIGGPDDGVIVGWLKSSMKLVSNRTSGVKYFVSSTVSLLAAYH